MHTSGQQPDPFEAIDAEREEIEALRIEVARLRTLVYWAMEAATMCVRLENDRADSRARTETDGQSLPKGILKAVP